MVHRPQTDDDETIVAQWPPKRRFPAKWLGFALLGLATVIGARAFLAERTRVKAAHRAGEALTAYVCAIRAGSDEPLEDIIDRRFHHALVERERLVQFPETSSACIELDNALLSLGASAPSRCEMLAGPLGCFALDPYNPTQSRTLVDSIEECAGEISLIDAAYVSPVGLESDRTSKAPTPWRFPDLPANEERYGSASFFPVAGGIVVTFRLREEERCTATRSQEALDCLRPATFTMSWSGNVTSLRSYSMPAGGRLWTRLVVDDEGTFFAEAKGPKNRWIFRRTLAGEEAEVMLSLGSPESTAPGSPPWLDAALPTIENPKWPRRVEATHLTPDGDPLLLEDGSTIALYLRRGQLLLTGSDEKGTLDVVRLHHDDTWIERAELQGTPDGHLVVMWVSEGMTFMLGSADGGRSWVGATGG